MNSCTPTQQQTSDHLLQVGLDISSLIFQRGVSRYTANLTKALAQRSDIELWLYGSSWRQHEALVREGSLLLTGTHNHHLKVDRFPPSVIQKLWQFNLYPVTQLLPHCQVFHSWDWQQPPDRQLPLTTTIHDLAMLHFPKTAHPKILAAHQRSWQRIQTQESIQVIAVSQATKKDIVNLLQINPQRVHVVYEALPLETAQTLASITPEITIAITQKMQLTNPYILFVGTQEPRKNLRTLIEAWQPLATECQLIIAGASGWQESETQNQPAFKHQPRYLGQVSNQELAVLYQQANVVAYPSLYEGFGLPILEAFATQTPVVTSNVSSLPEVAGNAAELVDPHSPESIQTGLTTALNYSPAELKTKKQQMQLRLQLFSWEKTAQQTMQVYHQAVSALHNQP